MSCIISLALGGDAIVRLWFKSMKSTRWIETWQGLLGDGPVPRSLEEVYARRAELIRSAAVDLDRDDGFWRVAGIGYDDDEHVPAEALA